MKIFSTDQPYVSKIHNIMLYDSAKEAGGKEFIEYNGTLYSYELIFFLDGVNITSFNGKALHNNENRIEYLPKGINNAKYVVDRQIHGHCIDIYFDTTDPMPQEALSFPIKDMRIRRLFEQSERVWQRREAGWFAHCLSLLYEIIALLQETAAEEYTPISHLNKIAASLVYLEQNYCQPSFNYRFLADQSAISYSYFKRLFIQKYGVSPSRYVTNLKIARAIELLFTGRFSISQIADKLGFDNVYYFSNFFKKETGVSPTEYMRKR